MDAFLCSVCYATDGVMQVSTTCGHQLCFNCTTKLVKKECPCCRAPFPENTTSIVYNACQECRGDLFGAKQCCENAICTMCMMAHLESYMGLEVIDVCKCVHCNTELPEKVQTLLENKKSMLIEMKRRKYRFERGTFTQPGTLSFCDYDEAYSQRLI